MDGWGIWAPESSTPPQRSLEAVRGSAEAKRLYLDAFKCWSPQSSLGKKAVPQLKIALQPLGWPCLRNSQGQRGEGLLCPGSHGGLAADLGLAAPLPTPRPGCWSLRALPPGARVRLHPLLLLQGKEKVLGILSRYMEVHGTVYYESQRPPEVPAFVKNHGLLPQPEFQQLLRKAKVSPPLTSSPSLAWTLRRSPPIPACHSHSWLCPRADRPQLALLSWASCPVPLGAGQREVPARQERLHRDRPSDGAPCGYHPAQRTPEQAWLWEQVGGQAEDGAPGWRTSGPEF